MSDTLIPLPLLLAGLSVADELYELLVFSDAFRLEKDGSALSGAQGDAAGSNRKQGCFHMYHDDQNGQHDQHNYVLKYIDTAADTSAHSYNIACIDWGGQGTTQITCNRSKGDSDNSYESRTFSTCTLTELAP